MKKNDLVEKIKRRLGAPTVKIELEDPTIIDNIDYSLQYYRKWAADNATQETFYTLMLSGGVSMYDLPGDVVEVVSYDVQSYGGVNQLFTMTNYMMNQGMFDQMLMRGAGSGYTVVSYHIARDFLETLKRYVIDAYTYKYHKYTNQLEIMPAPTVGESYITVGTTQYDSPGFILLRCYTLEGSDEDLYSNIWVLDYATAMCKHSLGIIRRKFGSFQAIGNMNLQLDGDSLINEAKEEMEKLDIKLREEEGHAGSWIIQG